MSMVSGRPEGEGAQAHIDTGDGVRNLDFHVTPCYRNGPLNNMKQAS